MTYRDRLSFLTKALRCDDFTGKNCQLREAVVEELAKGNVLHGVLYPKVHGNGFEKKKPSGALLGHTYCRLSAKGMTTVIYNEKDQVLRLWDLRKMHAAYEAIANYDYGFSRYDYR